MFANFKISKVFHVAVYVAPASRRLFLTGPSRKLPARCRRYNALIAVHSLCGTLAFCNGEWRRLQPVGVGCGWIDPAATKPHRLKPAPLDAFTHITNSGIDWKHYLELRGRKF